MEIRQAEVKDINRLHEIRMSVKQNVLLTPSLVTYADYENYLTVMGRGWIAEIEKQIVGFAIIDTSRYNIWALFVDPRFENLGVGRKLHDTMLDWHFSANDTDLWLTTEPGTRAEKFYTNAGWKNLGLAKNGEIKFEITKQIFIK